MYPNKIVYLSLVLIFTLVGCDPQGPHMNVAKSATVSTKGGGAPGYDSVKPIFSQICSKCHPARSGPDWMDYSAALAYVKNGKLFDRVVDKKTMPDPNDPISAQMTQAMRDTIAAWIKAGGPEHSIAATADAGGAETKSSDAASPITGPDGLPVSAFVRSCFQCHGVNGPSAQAQPRLPRLSGLSYDYLITQLRDFQSRDRLNDVMNDMVSAPRVSDAELVEAAKYYAALEGMSAKTMEPPTIEDLDKYGRGQKIALDNCNQCHRNPGPRESHTPLLDGQSEEYLMNQLLNFKRGFSRGNSTMREIAQSLTFKNMQDLAYYFTVSRQAN